MKKILNLSVLLFLLMLITGCGNSGENSYTPALASGQTQQTITAVSAQTRTYAAEDILILQDYLLGRRTDTDGKSFDLDNDGSWNVLDLCRLKHEVLSNIPQDNDNDILVVYFSVTSNTRPWAESIAEVTNADLCEIVPQVPYTAEDIAYNNSGCRANLEQNDDSARPLIDGTIEDMDKYEIVFIGYPIWWGREPRIIDTFMESYYLDDKVMIPFCTSGSTGISKSEEDLHSFTNESTKWKTGKRFSGSVSNESVKEWTDSLDLAAENEKTMQISITSGEYNIVYKLNNSTAAKELYAQLPISADAKPFSNNEITFYPDKLSTKDSPLSNGATGSLSYYEPWGDVVMFYGPADPNNDLYEIGTVVSGIEMVSKLSGTLTISAF